MAGTNTNTNRFQSHSVAIVMIRSAAEETCIEILNALCGYAECQNQDGIGSTQIEKVKAVCSDVISEISNQAKISLDNFDPEKGESFVQQETIELACFVLIECAASLNRTEERILDRGPPESHVLGILSLGKKIVCGFNSAEKAIIDFLQHQKEGAGASAPTVPGLIKVAQQSAYPGMHPTK